ncbi:MAG: thioredoxin domain-containing protein [Ardenticatenaceae bacterium]|nr:thioredoxin domain-containing protein [Anaerolineales bacterium]MCB8941229.1 thioredoxin domain-containing protein [Ardenticatenaceae bacterium]MCB8972568.1 thioredoxin domain-containing protein [Ardenticatenaceae bacterium]
MFFSTKKFWGLTSLLLLLLAACGAANANPIATNPESADSLLPRDGGALLAENETAVSNNPAINVADGSVELDADGIEVGFTEDGRPYRGNPNASVVMEEFSDYQCPFCGRFVAETFPSINDNQIANGQVLLIFYDFPLNIHPQAEIAANAARCAGEQGALAYWEMHDLLFTNINQWGNNQATTYFASYGEQIGLEMEPFTSCLDENKYIEDVRADYQIGLSRGVSSTPSFFINEQPLIGAQPLATFNEAIALISSGESIVEEPGTQELPPEYAVPTPAAIAVEAENVAWSAGNPDAPVQIVEFTDYQCPFCQQYAVETFPTVFAEMIESGRVFYAIKDLPLDNLHPEAIVAATAVRCAGEQEAYKEMHDAVFANQSLWAGNGETAAINAFADLAKEIGIDSDALVSCIALGEQREQVLANQQESFALGVNSTPTFYMNGYPLRGAQPIEVFEGVAELIETGQLEARLELQMQQAYAQAQAQATQQAQPAPPSGPVDVPIEGAYAIGDPNAPVTIVEYTDYECPFCSRHYAQTFLQLKEDYIDAGLVYYVFKDFPLTQIHPDAVLAANAARCAGEQEAYPAMHGALFANQDAWSGNPQIEEIFNGYAAELGLDEAQFADCLTNRTYEDAIFADLNEGIGFGINGTPAFFLNGYFLSGAQPYSTFVDAIAFFMEKQGN